MFSSLKLPHLQKLMRKWDEWEVRQPNWLPGNSRETSKSPSHRRGWMRICSGHSLIDLVCGQEVKPMEVSNWTKLLGYSHTFFLAIDCGLLSTPPVHCDIELVCRSLRRHPTTAPLRHCKFSDCVAPRAGDCAHWAHHMLFNPYTKRSTRLFNLLLIAFNWCYDVHQLDSAKTLPTKEIEMILYMFVET